MSAQSTRDDTHPLLELEGVSFSYPSASRVVLEDISLVASRGVNVGVVGESGAGKSTLLSLLLGLQKPTRGRVLFRGGDIPVGAQRTMRDFRRSVQMVFQDPYSSLDPRQRVRDIIAEPLRSLRLGDVSSRVNAVAEALVAVGLSPDAAARYPHEFSGGQRQRIAIARAIAPQPELLLADEPVSALDMTTRVSILELLGSVGRERNMSVIMVSHDLSAVATLCQQTVVLQNGRVVEQGNTGDILGAPADPYTARLVASVPRLPGIRG
ncbi:ABC transporter ATP-binding protein [Lysinibacter sp. HNR]|uniref:ABC transporter ATP-binding protein n=1 Tax=Lysinibacter sp. HNR TaxID=3031408 RepID=UPI002435B78E|nr:ABC transporter ATP-binding protein [Lysinibacter sp. HNR]WGD37911.1 ABC transporter ATP-binding protein [Lysinibacter sp. HNR]